MQISESAMIPKPVQNSLKSKMIGKRGAIHDVSRDPARRRRLISGPSRRSEAGLSRLALRPSLESAADHLRAAFCDIEDPDDQAEKGGRSSASDERVSLGVPGWQTG